SLCAPDTTRLSSWTRAINVDRVLRRGSTSAPFRGRSRSEDLHLTEHVFGSQEKNPNFSCDARRPRRARPVADRLPDTMELHEAVPELEDVFARWAIVEHTPAIAWGLIHDGELIAARGLGTLRVGENAQPDSGSVFRIASMTKSFTGAALMSLVVEGAVRL